MHTVRIHILDYDKINIFQFSLLSLVNGVNSVITLADSYFDSLERSGSKICSICYLTVLELDNYGNYKLFLCAMGVLQIYFWDSLKNIHTLIMAIFIFGRTIPLMK